MAGTSLLYPMLSRLKASRRGAMALGRTAIDPIADRAATAVLAAYDAAAEARLSLVDCYRAGVKAWRRAHPDQRAEYASQQAVAVILAAKVSLRLLDE